MNLVMASKNTNNDYESRYLNMLEDKLTAISLGLEKNTETTNKILKQTTKTNGRVTALENAVFNKVDESKLKPFYKDPKVVQIALYVVLTFLMLVATVTGFDLRGLL